jgi:hypothetical protein
MDIPNEVVLAPPMMDTALLWIGFDQEATRERLRAEGFDTFDDLSGMKKDICDLADSYTRRTVADGRTIFGLKRSQVACGFAQSTRDHWLATTSRRFAIGVPICLAVKVEERPEEEVSLVVG